MQWSKQFIGFLVVAVMLSACGGGDSAGDRLAQAPMAAEAQPLLGASVADTGASAAPAAAPLRDVTLLSNAALFNWAPTAYPQYFSGSYTAGTLEGYDYRYFPAKNNYVAVKNGMVYVLGPVSDGEILAVGSVLTFTCLISPSNCTTTATPTPTQVVSTVNVSTGNVHNLLKTWRTSQSGSGTLESWNHNTATDAQGTLLQRTQTACTVAIDTDGNVVWNNNNTYSLEVNSGATNTTGATRARLYAKNSSTGAIDLTSYIEIVKDAGARQVTTYSPIEQWCVNASVYQTSGRFPTSDGRLGSYAGNWTGTVADTPMLMLGGLTIPAALKTGASCNAVIDPIGNVTVTILGTTLPTFSTYDRNMDQSILATMFSNNPILNPASTYALRTNAGAFNGIINLYPPAITYYDFASPSFSAPWAVTCAMRKTS